MPNRTGNKWNDDFVQSAKVSTSAVVPDYMEDCSLTISALISCPHKDCDAIIDLFRIDGLTEEGYLYDELLSNKGYGKQNFGEIIQCPECKKQITINNVNW